MSGKGIIVVPFMMTIMTGLGRSDSCQRNGVYNVSSTIYCRCCDSGFFKKGDCNVSGEIAICMPCPDKQYSSTPNQAIRCSPCEKPAWCLRPHAVVKQDCTSKSNIKCECENGYYLRSRLGSNSDGDCMSHSQCGPGKVIIQEGTSSTDTKCGPCPNGTFSPLSDFSTDCQNCSQCQSPSLVKHLCNRTSNTVCKTSSQDLENQQNLGLLIGIPLGCFFLAVIVILILILTYYKCRQRRCKSRSNRQNKDDRRSNSHLMNYTNNENGEFQGILGSDVDNLPVPQAVLYQQNGQNNLHNVEVPNQAQPVEKGESRSQKRWESCFRWLAQQIIKDRRFILRNLFEKINMDSDRGADSVIDEMEANYGGDVREQIYRVFMKWYELNNPKKLDLNILVSVLQERDYVDVAEELSRKYPDLCKESTVLPPGRSLDDDESGNHGDRVMEIESSRNS